MADRTRSVPFAGTLPLARTELRRWVPGRAAVLAGTSLAIMALVTLTFRGEADTPLGEILAIALSGWAIVVAVVVVAATQDVLAGDIADGAAAWTLALPVTRRAYVVAKFTGAALAVTVSAVIVPGALAYPLFASTATVREEFSAVAVLDALQREPESYAGLPSFAEYAGLLLLLALLAVFLVAVLVALGTRLTSTATLLGLGLTIAALAVTLGLVGADAGGPWVAVRALSTVGLREVSLVPAALASAGWSLVVVVLAAWSFERRPL